eukprot:366392-Chlamydomonas_euryale.AAC.2
MEETSEVEDTRRAVKQAFWIWDSRGLWRQGRVRFPNEAVGDWCGGTTHGCCPCASLVKCPLPVCALHGYARPLPVCALHGYARPLPVCALHGYARPLPVCALHGYARLLPVCALHGYARPLPHIRIWRRSWYRGAPPSGLGRPQAKGHLWAKGHHHLALDALRPRGTFGPKGTRGPRGALRARGTFGPRRPLRKACPFPPKPLHSPHPFLSVSTPSSQIKAGGGWYRSNTARPKPAMSTASVATSYAGDFEDGGDFEDDDVSVEELPKPRTLRHVHSGRTSRAGSGSSIGEEHDMHLHAQPSAPRAAEEVWMNRVGSVGGVGAGRGGSRGGAEACGVDWVGVGWVNGRRGKVRRVGGVAGCVEFCWAGAGRVLRNFVGRVLRTGRSL